jgi:hypothetical protein
MRVILLGALSGVLLASSAQATNLVANGDFEAGNTDFGSDYTFVSGANSATPPAVYAIDDSPRDVHNSFAVYGDHTTGSGNMMIVNGSESPDERVWFQDGIAVLANTTYFFSTWIRSALNGAPAMLDFSINGSPIGPTFTAGPVEGGWQQFFASWDSGASTVANISLVNRQLAYGGNDFALDDISLSVRSPEAIPEPSAWALMILGFGAAGAMFRRQARMTRA